MSREEERLHAQHELDAIRAQALQHLKAAEEALARKDAQPWHCAVDAMASNAALVEELTAAYGDALRAVALIAETNQAVLRELAADPTVSALITAHTAVLDAARALPAADLLSGVAAPDAPDRDKREAVMERAVEVIGDREQAMRWLGTPVRALDFATPISRLHDPKGQADVLKVLARLEHGVL